MKPFIYRQEVRFPDVDHAGIAFFGALLTYCHYAHEEWLKMLGLPLTEMLGGRRFGFPLVRVESDFESPARHGDMLRIEVELDRLGERSIALKYTLYNETTQRRVGVTKYTQASVNLEEMKSVPIPDDVRGPIERWMSADGAD